jgi:EpsI family protein
MIGPLKVYHRSSLLALLTILLATVLFQYQLKKISDQVILDINLDALPYSIGDWEGKDTRGLDLRSQEILQLDRFVKRIYTHKDGREVLLYIGYWGKQSGEHQAAKHSPTLCLPSNGWVVSGREKSEIGKESSKLAPITARSLIGEFRGNRQLFYYWFFTGQDSYADEWLALLKISMQTLFAGRSDGGIVEVSTPLSLGNGVVVKRENAEGIVEDFLDDLYPELRKVVDKPTPKTTP